jgi:hypothetical protein
MCVCVCVCVYIYIYTAQLNLFTCFYFGYSKWAATCKLATGIGTILVRS